jgi:hypothetical protein
MKRRFELVGFCVLGVLIAFSTTAVAATIEGTVTDDGTRVTPLEFIEVQFFDAASAELLATSTTGSSGNYGSGIIPTGDYRIRYSDTGQYTPGLYLPEFSGSAGQDAFCSATVYSLGTGESVIVDETMTFTDPSLVVIRNFSIAGSVTDSATGRPIEGVVVEFRNGMNGLEISSGKEGGGTTTDVNGEYMARFEVRISPTVRVRFVDPSGTYFPEYAGTFPRSDEFCSGTAYEADGVHNVDLILGVVPVDQQAQELIDTIDELALANNVQNSLGTPLVRAVDLLVDDNPMNDNAVCTQLRAFISRVDIQERQGRLSVEDADVLRQQSKALSDELGC